MLFFFKIKLVSFLYFLFCVGGKHLLFLTGVLTLTSALSLLLGEELLDAVVTSGELLLFELVVLLFELLDGLAVEGDVFLFVNSLEELAGEGGALTLGDTELVAFEFGGVGEGGAGSGGLGAASVGELSKDVLGGEGSLDLLGGGVGGDGDGELGGFDVAGGLDVAPHLVVFSVFDEDTVGVDDGGDDTDLISAGSTEDADEATDLDVVLLDHFGLCC